MCIGDFFIDKTVYLVHRATWVNELTDLHRMMKQRYDANIERDNARGHIFVFSHIAVNVSVNL